MLQCTGILVQANGEYRMDSVIIFITLSSLLCVGLITNLVVRLLLVVYIYLMPFIQYFMLFNCEELVELSLLTDPISFRIVSILIKSLISIFSTHQSI